MSGAFDPAREEAELRTYLGDEFDLERLRHYDEAVEREFSGSGDEAAFYRSSHAYLYNLTAFAMTATKQPYLEVLRRFVAPGARLLDYGCGIGSDGLQLLEEGYRVAFADFANPSVAYLRWRLAHRGLQAPIHDLDERVPAGFDAAYAFDVIEHVEDPLGFLDQLEERAGLVCVNLLEPVPGETALHHELPVRALLRHLALHHRLRFHQRFHGRSHLVVYATGPPASGPAGWAARLRAAAAVSRARR